MKDGKWGNVRDNSGCKGEDVLMILCNTMADYMAWDELCNVNHNPDRRKPLQPMISLPDQ